MFNSQKTDCDRDLLPAYARSHCPPFPYVRTTNLNGKVGRGGEDGGGGGRGYDGAAEWVEEASVRAVRSQRNIVGIHDYHLFYKTNNSHLCCFAEVGEIDHVHVFLDIFVPC